LRDPMVDQFFGLILNYCYWNCIHPVARAVLKTAVFQKPELFDNNYPRFMSTGDNKTSKLINSTTDDDSIESQSSTGISMDSSVDFASIGSESSYTAQEKENLYLKLEICIITLNKKVKNILHIICYLNVIFSICSHFLVGFRSE
jgi:hypothetical protein